MSAASITAVGAGMSLQRAAKAVSGVLLGLMLLCGGTGIAASWQQSLALERQAAASSLLHNHTLADMMHDAIRSDVLAALQAQDPASTLKREDIEKDFAEHLATLEKNIAADGEYTGSAEVAAVTSKLVAPMQAYAATARGMLADTARDPEAARRALPNFFDQFRALEDSMGAASEAIEKHAQETSASGKLVGIIAIVVLLITLALGMGVAFAVATAVRRRVVEPIVSQAGTMRKLGAGDLTAEVIGTERADELGDMARAMVAFRDQLQAAEQAKEAQAQLIVDSLGSGLTALAHGDLTAQVTADLQPPFAQLKSNFNGAVSELRSLIGTVMESAATIRTGSGEIAQASEDLARRTEANAASLEETSAAVTQMDGRLKATAASAGRTVERADGAIATVSGGRSIADEAVQAMTRVADSAKGIDSVIEGLDKIAFQTRVLAMNAAVEAGRAGEAGRGFAVVADLVSALAMRAEEEAGRARDQLTATQTDIVAAVEMVQKVDSALADISGDVSEVHTLLGEMASDNQAQSTAISEISIAIGTMDQSTQQNAAMVEQTSAAARNLSGEVAALSEQASKFNVGNGARPFAARASAPARTSGHASPAKAFPVAAMANGGAGSGDWASF
ncbi:methyl-accepting chemotaxis protein [Sphingomonas sp. Root241]|uniref:methyl-accepting chemotaxis protein n=1 Tax=Sphingomonas sp. Root241 TaxID=1736501 RepID=UPI0006FF001B|nr:methyl-accepting chemotaxis protein [Sphingomonas sp. Root241]KRC82604.1 chemotaxis protein [Sphingomonas sp. Root241]